MNPTTAVLPIVIVFAIAGGARAAPATSEGGSLYAPCVPCHQPGAGGSPDGSIPSLAGQQPHYLEKQIAAFRSATRDSTSMQIVTVHPTFSDRRNIHDLAGYLADLQANPHPVVGSGDHLRVGQELYAHICAACHGISGLGQSGTGAPRIAGQHYPYIRRQIETAAVLHEELHPPQMLSAIRSMRPQEKEALADYISRLGNSDALLDSNRPAGTDSRPPPP